ncbi:MAG TPA: cytidylate kinase-like family protein [Anaerolineaceae bacterium]|jgi:cytidylate kinase
MGTITISREIGSSGCQVARAAAQRLGYQVVWRDAINQAAMRAGAPEMALAVIDDLGLLGLHPDPRAVQAYLRAIAQVLVELADAGDTVIIGRAGQVILRSREDVFHVRVMAPVETRVARLAASRGITPQAAHAQVTASDRSRSLYLRQNYSAAWDDPDLYDLILNTARLTAEDAGDLIARASKFQFSATQHHAHPAAIEFDCD